MKAELLFLACVLIAVCFGYWLHGGKGAPAPGPRKAAPLLGLCANCGPCAELWLDPMACGLRPLLYRRRPTSGPIGSAGSIVPITPAGECVACGSRAVIRSGAGFEASRLRVTRTAS